ncbi:hypothetical protein HDU92_003346 [Lobulomyces angularis]|nr:hypothetical protein HDU92_003346 [Lobulomyces angularis]
MSFNISEADLSKAITDFKVSEMTYFNSFNTDIQSLLVDLNYNINDLYFYGEILFFLKNLKPAILFSFPNQQLNDLILPNYINKLLNNLLLDLGNNNKDGNFFNLYKIKNFKTEKFNFSNVYLLYNPRYPVFSDILSNNNFSSLNRKSDDVKIQEIDSFFITEHNLSVILDYPSTLEESDFTEVSYIDYNKTDNSFKLITSFAAKSNELEAVKSHFVKYRSNSLGILDLRLVI